jgi:hypothetical protein
LQELKTPDDDHVIVTAPDRFFQDAIVILLVDWPADLIDQAISSIKGSNVRLAIHVFDFNDHDFNWLIDVANQADVISLNLNNINHIDIFKGYLIPKSNAFYFGRLGINKFFTNFTNDPIGTLLVKIGNKISQMEAK